MRDMGGGGDCTSLSFLLLLYLRFHGYTYMYSYSRRQGMENSSVLWAQHRIIESCELEGILKHHPVYFPSSEWGHLQLDPGAQSNSSLTSSVSKDASSTSAKLPSFYPRIPSMWEGPRFSVLLFYWEENNFHCGRVQKCSLTPVPSSCW